MFQTRKPRRRLTVTDRRRFNHKYRVRILAGFLIFLILVIVGRLWQLQVVQAQQWRDRAERQYMISAELPPTRGNIYLNDRKELYPVAINKDYALIYVVPRSIAPERRKELLEFLKEKLGDKIDEEAVEKKLARENDPYEIIARHVEWDLAKEIVDADFDGVFAQRESYRYYPAGKLAAQVVGFVASDGERKVGMYGIERSFEKVLSGRPGNLKQARDTAGRWISLRNREYVPPEDGADVVLTIDYTVQTAVEEILNEAVEKHRADRGSIVVMRPNGQILAMASVPTFDLNDFGSVEDQSLFVNPIVSHTYEPGSVIKPLTMAFALDAGKITPQTTYVDTGEINEAGYTIRNSENKVYGLQTMTQVLEKSINTGVIHVERLLGHKKFAEYFERFGFGRKTGIDLPAEASGNTQNLKPPIRPIQFYTASFGQGVTVTLLQVARAYGVLANDGMMMKPQIVERIIYPDGRVEKIQPQEEYRVIRAETARQVRSMLESVVVNGHGRRTAVPGYRVGGKTGTAQVARSDAKGYDDSVTIGSFVGISPIEKPEFVVAVQINNPKDVIWAQATAGPAFRKTMKFLLDYYDIEPTEEVNSEKKEKI